MNLSYIAHFLGGLGCIYVAVSIAGVGNSGGFFFKSHGLEAYINALLLIAVGLILAALPFLRVGKRPVSWVDVFLSFALLMAVEPIAHFIALLFQ